MHSRDIYLLLFYSIWTLRTTLIQRVSVLFIAALYTPYSNLKFLIFLILVVDYTCSGQNIRHQVIIHKVESYNKHDINVAE